MAINDKIGQDILNSQRSPEVVEGASELSHFYTMPEITITKHLPNDFEPVWRYGIRIDEREVKSNLNRLFAVCWDPVCDIFGKQPLGSVYRCARVNKLVGGDANSAHLAGLALDTQPPRCAEIIAFLNKNAGLFLVDRIIMEERPGVDREHMIRWMHVQILQPDAQPRRVPKFFVSPTKGQYDACTVEQILAWVLRNSKKVAKV